MALTPTTKLEAVNKLLQSIGETKVNSLASGLSDAEQAEITIDSISREVQTAGWSFNTELKYTLAAESGTGFVYLPSNTLRVDNWKYYPEKNYVQRGLRIYDSLNHTYAINQSVIVNLVVLLDFTDLPEAARRYITIRAARIFQDETVGSMELHGYKESDELQALVEMKDAEAETGDYNVFDNYAVARILNRNVSNKILG